jgi:hypothetical protein
MVDGQRVAQLTRAVPLDKCDGQDRICLSPVLTQQSYTNG